MMPSLRNTACCLLMSCLMHVPSLHAQQGGEVKQDPSLPQEKLTQEELDQLLAPIALYPDSLLSQIFMASTYPLEIVEAERWVKQNGSLAGDALATALENEPWDPSVKSLVGFPQVLTMMSEKLEWTTKLGDAFLSQQEEVLGSVQKLRSKAKEQGNLESSNEQIVKVEQPAGAAATTQNYITIESANPEVVYVPTYDPTAIYGEWWWPRYPPYYYYPPSYVARPGVWFGAGVACGVAWGYAWGHCDWHHGDIDIDINRNTRINNHIDRSRYRNNNFFQGDKGRWQHNPSHRRGAPYRDQQLARKYNKPTYNDAAKSREAFRGRADAGRQDLARGGADQLRNTAPVNDRIPNRPNRPADRTPAASDRNRTPDRPTRPAPAAQDRRPTGNRSTGNANRGGAFGGGQSGQAARQQSQRGQSSRSNASRPSSGGSSGGGRAPARSGGGGARGGGGGRRR